MSAPRTYAHLEHLGRVPSEYDIASGKLLYYLPDRGFEVRTPAGDWHSRHQAALALRVRDWEQFRDPRETTYARYVELQREKEAFVDGLLRSMEKSGYDRTLSRGWLEELGAVLPVLRFPWHGLQMVAAFLGQIAPAGRIVIGCAFQVGDEIRRIQRVAYRMCQLRAIDPDFGAGSKAAWQEGPEWQPLRRAIELLLVTYDFGEALVALDWVLKPWLDRLLTLELGRLAREHGDPRLEEILFSLSEDCSWHHEFGGALVRFALDDDPANGPVVETWLRRWRGRVREATTALAPLFGPDFEAANDRAEAACVAAWTAAGMKGLGA